MAFTYDVTTDRGKLRLLLSDVTADNYQFEDDEIDAFLTIGNNNLYWSAALGLEVIASNEMMVHKRIEILGLTINAPAVATELRRIAGNWREVSFADEAFDIAEVPVDSAAYNEKYLKEILREELG